MMRLQAHNFQWEDEPLEVLLKKYPKCKIALQWWCNAYYTAENGVQQMSRFSISRNKWLKEFIIQNPPDFPISNKCCECTKKKPAKQFIKEMETAAFDSFKQFYLFDKQFIKLTFNSSFYRLHYTVSCIVISSD